MANNSLPVPTYRLILIGLFSSAFFSVTFLMNYVMHLGGGHWAWSAALRFIFMLPLMAPILLLFKGVHFFIELIHAFLRNLVFWTIAGTVGFGLFYAGICYAAGYSRGWLVAATWQTTILMTPFVLILFGLKMPRRGIFLSWLIVGGVAIVNYAQFKQGIDREDILYGVIPVLLSAIAYPVGNQMLNAAKNNAIDSIKIAPHILQSPLACVFLMTLGSAPFWILLILCVQPPLPSTGQIYGSLSVAFFSGICATTLFYWARNSTTSAIQIAAVDATLAGEVVIVLAVEIFLLKQPIPDALSLTGLAIITFGLIGYCYRSSTARPAN